MKVTARPYFALLATSTVGNQIQFVVNGVDQKEEEFLSVVLIRARVLSIEIADDRLEIVE